MTIPLRRGWTTREKQRLMMAGKTRSQSRLLLLRSWHGAECRRKSQKMERPDELMVEHMAAEAKSQRRNEKGRTFQPCKEGSSKHAYTA